MAEFTRPSSRASRVSDIQPWMLVNYSGYMNAGQIEDVSRMVPDASWNGGSRNQGVLAGSSSVVARAVGPREAPAACQ